MTNSIQNMKRSAPSVSRVAGRPTQKPHSGLSGTALWLVLPAVSAAGISPPDISTKFRPTVSVEIRPDTRQQVEPVDESLRDDEGNHSDYHAGHGV